MISISRLSLWLSATFVISNCQLLPLASYRHDIAFPSITGELRTTTNGNNDQQPALRQFSAGFHLNPPPPLPFLQSFPINSQFFSDVKDSLRSGYLFPRPKSFGPPSLRNLFTPTTSRERPETEGQQEEYRKYLQEEAEDLEKESHNNDITTDFSSFESTSLQPTQNTFVRLNIQGKDYSYST
ncbi:unnamed protein product [Ceutorhynchus assimilis]|uniref:Uncharacterized protein n=1 Tax=Ceutorhynchus assimilis TaxID=467358 RepID=A0A9P0GQ06_9CUCU|nr:unnamed protein product [Ceutorhynchus assimilis]